MVRDVARRRSRSKSKSRSKSRGSRRSNRTSRGRRYFPHIYFESKAIRGKDSVYEAVPDISRPRVNTAKEVKLLTAATIADLADGYTVDHRGRRIRFTRKLLSGRFLVLRRLAKRYGGKRAVETGYKIAREALEIPAGPKRKRFIKEQLKEKLGLATETIEQLIARTNKFRR